MLWCFPDYPCLRCRAVWKTLGTMLSHNVFFWLKPDLTDEQRKEFVEALSALRTIPALHTFLMGTPADVADRPVVDKSFDYSVTCLFENIPIRRIRCMWHFSSRVSRSGFARRFTTWIEAFDPQITNGAPSGRALPCSLNFRVPRVISLRRRSPRRSRFVRPGNVRGS